MFLILTRAGDLHAHSIAWALTELGHKARVLSYADLRPNISQLSATSNDQQISLKWGNFDIAQNELSAIWLRKPPLSLIHLSENHNDSQNIFERSNFDESLNLYLQGAVHSISSLAPIINAPNHSIIASNKLYQLQLCNMTFLRMPKTYIGCNKEDILNFFNEHEDIVYKPLRHNVWYVNGMASVCKTTAITREELLNTVDNELLPGVFQEQIKKSREYRVIIFGNEIVSIEQTPIYGSNHEIDWRFSNISSFNRSYVTLSKNINEDCLAIVKSLSLDHASIDIAVDELGQYFFLEVNPFGQFMAYEEELPQTRLLEKSAKLMLDKAKVNYKPYDFSDIKTENFLSSFDSKVLKASINNGDHVHDVVSKKSLSLIQCYKQE